MNPLKEWWKVKRYFKPPTMHIHIGELTWFYGRLPYIHRKFIDFEADSLGWKDKYSSPRHEWDPFIAITFFKKFEICITFNFDKGRENDNTRSMATWEAIIDMLYYKRSLMQVCNEHVWVTMDRQTIDIKSNLTKRALNAISSNK
jgi:hypothetical protein